MCMVLSELCIKLNIKRSNIKFIPQKSLIYYSWHENKAYGACEFTSGLWDGRIVIQIQQYYRRGNNNLPCSVQESFSFVLFDFAFGGVSTVATLFHLLLVQ